MARLTLDYLLFDGEIANTDGLCLTGCIDLFQRSPNLCEVVVVADSDVPLSIFWDKLVV
jgi:hypothetical protein